MQVEASNIRSWDGRVTFFCDEFPRDDHATPTQRKGSFDLGVRMPSQPSPSRVPLLPLPPLLPGAGTEQELVNEGHCKTADTGHDERRPGSICWATGLRYYAGRGLLLDLGVANVATEPHGRL